MILIPLWNRNVTNPDIPTLKPEESENLTQSPEKALYPINEEAGKLITKKGSEQMRLLKRAFTVVALLAALLIIIFLVG